MHFPQRPLLDAELGTIANSHERIPTGDGQFALLACFQTPYERTRLTFSDVPKMHVTKASLERGVVLRGKYREP